MHQGWGKIPMDIFTEWFGSSDSSIILLAPSSHWKIGGTTWQRTVLCPGHRYKFDGCYYQTIWTWSITCMTTLVVQQPFHYFFSTLPLSLLINKCTFQEDSKSSVLLHKVEVFTHPTKRQWYGHIDTNTSTVITYNWFQKHSSVYYNVSIFVLCKAHRWQL